MHAMGLSPLSCSPYFPGLAKWLPRSMKVIGDRAGTLSKKSTLSTVLHCFARNTGAGSTSRTSERNIGRREMGRQQRFHGEGENNRPEEKWTEIWDFSRQKDCKLHPGLNTVFLGMTEDATREWERTMVGKKSLGYIEARQENILRGISFLLELTHHSPGTYVALKVPSGEKSSHWL